MYQVTGGGIAKATITTPRRCPNQMESAVRSADDRRVAHHMLKAYRRTQEHALDGVPFYTVLAVYKPQALRGWLMERSRHIDILRRKRDEANG
jgi:hypothetical protein